MKCNVSRVYPKRAAGELTSFHQARNIFGVWAILTARYVDQSTIAGKAAAVLNRL